MSEQQVPDNPILVDLAKHLERKLRTAMADFVDTCRVVDIPDRESGSAMMAVLAAITAQTVGKLTNMPADDFGNRMSTAIDKVRALKAAKEEAKAATLQ